MKKIIVLVMVGLITFACETPRNNAALEADSIKIMMDSIFNKPLSKEPIKVDTKKLKKLKLNFRTSKDEFNTDNVTFYYHKSSPKFTDRNALYLYFANQTNKTYPLNIRFQYYANDWLFVKSIQFLIDGNVYGYIPNEVKRDNADGEIWEWFDESVDTSDRDLIIALSKAKSAKMKINGDVYSKQKTITSSQIKAIKETIELHEMLGGSL